MKIKRLLLPVLLVSFLFTYACNGTDETALDEENEIGEIENPSNLQPDEIEQLALTSSYTFDIKVDDSGEMPKSEISIMQDGQILFPLKIVDGAADKIHTSQYAEMEIPENASDACGAWWAGAGDYFYILPDGNDFKVFIGWQAEEQEDRGYHWELLQMEGAN